MSNEQIKIKFNEEEEAETYEYLGVPLNNKCQEEREINARLTKSNRCVGAKQGAEGKKLSWKTKIGVYKQKANKTDYALCLRDVGHE